MRMDLTDLTPAQQNAMEADAFDIHVPSDEDMQWYMEQTYVDPMERVDW